MKIPAPGRPYPVEGYGIPQSEEGLLSWEFVSERMARSRNYWVVSVSPDGRPHAVPVWGLWVDDTFYFGGGPQTRWMRNLNDTPYVVVHLESGDEVVIIEGTAEWVTPDPDLGQRLDKASRAKYKMPGGGGPTWALRPHKVLAWQEYPVSMTRWVFEQGDDGR
ncbi:MAG: pyridoxamine 5'-phosphate oxidase family protein [Chloroflexi bacterium]|nr:pyridoxamine 5'-phosphate oxidase family protein [Chloroflexota bacterium]MCI0579329.1 pyridoxamine 5'-phosphate oxidase family protein [Chloroflexota bacterium]MCI0644972.1 pyridoxamine 5'-phosphate oxidase family protein [Chloroflexota bacterium]MCI0727851.1 pyridoxamine 5'-phosphate oxidase family protein [Chloroflexota bacterium]